MDIVCLGEMLIDMFPAEIGRRLVEVSAFYPVPGGAPANVAVAARRLGAETAFIGKVGDDAFGRLLIDTLQAEGVETRAMRIDEEARTTMAFIAMPNPNTAEWVFYRNPGADMMLRRHELDVDLLRATKALHIGTISLIAEPGRSATFRAVELAREAGALISLDINYRPSLWPKPEAAVNAIRSVIALAHVVKVNSNELVLLMGNDDPEAGSAALLRQGPRVCIVTMGEKGSFFRLGDETAFVPAFRVETVDAVGCGDAFMAGLLVRLVGGESGSWQERLSAAYLRESLRYANAVGALTAQKKGVIPALPTAAEVEAFLKTRS